MVIAVGIAALTLLDTHNVAARHLVPGALRTPCERQLIDAVRAASPPVERSRLIATRIRGELYLWYGDPDYPSGRIPFGIHGYRNYEDGHPTEARAIYHVIGTVCNYYINAADRFPFAGTWAGCDTWHPDKADRVAARYARCQFHVTRAGVGTIDETVSTR